MRKPDNLAASYQEEPHPTYFWLAYYDDVANDGEKAVFHQMCKDYLEELATSDLSIDENRISAINLLHTVRKTKQTDTFDTVFGIAQRFKHAGNPQDTEGGGVSVYRASLTTMVVLQKELMEKGGEHEVKEKMFPFWKDLWEGEDGNLWPITTAGLRITDPNYALNELPKAFEKAKIDPDFSLINLIFAFAADPNTAGKLIERLTSFGILREAQEIFRETDRKLDRRVEPKINLWQELLDRIAGNTQSASE